MNVFDFAMKMELDGKAFYENLAAGTAISGLKTIFAMLAEDEQKHYDTILKIKGKTGDFAMADTRVLEEARNIFEVLVQDKLLLDTMGEDLDGYKLAMKIEADSVRMYEDAAAKEPQENIKSIFLKIAEEEKNHYNIVENIYDFVLRPKYFLAWGEFSNLKEL